MATSKTIASTAAFVLPRHPDQVVRSLAGSALSQTPRSVFAKEGQRVAAVFGRKAAEEVSREVAGEGVRGFLFSGGRLSKLFR
jgi:hypothetical protein